MSDTFGAATVTAAVHAILLLLWVYLWRNDSRRPLVGKAQMKPRTLRISNIPEGISKGGFEAILARVAVELGTLSDATDQPRLLGYSFAAAAHADGSFVATATFCAPPAPAELEDAIRRSSQTDWARLRVDMDFFGLTPLADPASPVVEYVVSRLLAEWVARFSTI